MGDRLLLDTHIVLWSMFGDVRLTSKTTSAILAADDVFVSAASAWEAQIKAGLGKLELPECFAEGVRKSGFQELPVHFHHTQQLAHLPALHRDPFDRLLVATAMADGLTLVSADAKILAYPGSLLDAR
ncbi:MAG: type II toxin-antitoxin system VapC family toxin [Myxococcota bacterium]